LFELTGWRLKTDKDKGDGGPAAGGTDPGTTPEAELGQGGGSKLVCARCGLQITTPAARIAVGGKIEHTFVNPHAIMFHITCFASAPGCVASGPSSTDFTWFPGHSWQIQLCGSCKTHLGWRFASPEQSFFGLVTDKLIEMEEDDDPPA
jgi:hypothetical protein